MFHVPEKYRVKRLRGDGLYSDESYGNNGVFSVPHWKPGRGMFRIQASDGFDWEHVSVSLPQRCPTWEEMCCIKDMFWDDDDCVVQFHPSKSDYVNMAKHCLHLWRPIDDDMPRPHHILVGLKSKQKAL